MVVMSLQSTKCPCGTIATFCDAERIEKYINVCVCVCVSVCVCVCVCVCVGVPPLITCIMIILCQFHCYLHHSLYIVSTLLKSIQPYTIH